MIKSFKSYLNLKSFYTKSSISSFKSEPLVGRYHVSRLKSQDNEDLYLLSDQILLQVWTMGWQVYTGQVKTKNTVSI